jgi:hypothetical protein
MTRQIERDLQREVMVRLRHAPVNALILPVPNGIWIPARSDTEKVLVARLIALLKADGLLTSGIADLLVLWRDGSGALELKRPASRSLIGKHHQAGRPSDAQKDFAASCVALGIRHAYCTSWPEVRDTLIAWGRLPQGYVDPEHRIGRAA